jgi:hypothetical protein
MMFGEGVSFLRWTLARVRAAKGLKIARSIDFISSASKNYSYYS